MPRLYEKVHTRIKGQFDEAVGLRRRLIDWALKVGHEAIPYKLRDEPLPAGLARKHRIADKLVYSKVKDKLGGRLRVAISGGAPLAPEIAEFFLTLDILILEGYGLSECTTACAVNLPGRVKFGTVGRILPHFEVRTAEDGEVLIRSETVFAGYYNDEEATREAIDADGWLHSGDIGEIDEDGYLRITDRKKDIIVTAGGKNLAPQSLENALKSSNLISQALVVGDRRPYVVALISLDEDELDGLSPEEAQETVRADRRRRQPQPLALRADQALRHRPARLLSRGRRGDADDEAEAADRRAALRRRDREALRRLRGLGVAPRAVEDGRVMTGQR